MLHIVKAYRNNLCVYFSCPYYDYSSLLSHQINYSIRMPTNKRKLSTSLCFLLNALSFVKHLAIIFLSSNKEIFKNWRKSQYTTTSEDANENTAPSAYRYPPSYISGSKAASEAPAFWSPVTSTSPPLTKCLSVATFLALEIMPPLSQKLLKIT